MTQRTPGIAITGLVLALVGLVIPVVLPLTALVLATIAWRQIKRSNGGLGGEGVVVGTWVAAPIVLLLNLLLIGLIATSWSAIEVVEEGGGPTAAEEGLDGATRDTKPSGRIVGWYEMRVGDCFVETAEDWAEELVPCTEPHEGEVVGIVGVDRRAYPTEAELDALGERECSRHFTTYVGIPPERANLYSSYIWPLQDAWDDGIHLIICYATNRTYDDLERSVRDAADAYASDYVPSPPATASQRSVHGLICVTASSIGCAGPLRSLAVGDCFIGAEPTPGIISEVVVSPCDQRHMGEVFAVVRLAGSAYEGRERLERRGRSACGDRFEGYTGMKPSDSEAADSTVTYGYVVPSEASWDHGHRHLTCFVASSLKDTDLYWSFRRPRP